MGSLFRHRSAGSDRLSLRQRHDQQSQLAYPLQRDGGETNGLRGSLCFDTTGLHGYDLVAVAGGDGMSDSGGVWRIDSQTNFWRITNLNNTHLEGVAVPADTNRYGPWAGTIPDRRRESGDALFR